MRPLSQPRAPNVRSSFSSVHPTCAPLSAGRKSCAASPRNRVPRNTRACMGVHHVRLLCTHALPAHIPQACDPAAPARRLRGNSDTGKLCAQCRFRSLARRDQHSGHVQFMVGKRTPLGVRAEPATCRFTGPNPRPLRRRFAPVVQRGVTGHNRWRPSACLAAGRAVVEVQGKSTARDHGKRGMHACMQCIGLLTPGMPPPSRLIKKSKSGHVISIPIPSNPLGHQPRVAHTPPCKRGAPHARSTST